MLSIDPMSEIRLVPFLMSVLVAGSCATNANNVADNCSSDPCKNGGTCISDATSYMCECAVGYSGPTCETSGEDACSTNRCQNGGSCVVKENGSACSCPAGYSGDVCEVAGVRSLGVGIYHTCALLAEGAIKCWGSNGLGELGQGDMVRRGDDAGEMGVNLLAIDLGPGRTCKSIAAAIGRTCALLDDGTVKCWGYNGLGELGQGDNRDRGDNPGEMGANLPAIDLGAGRTAKAIALGGAHTCALLDNDTVKCWGYNGSGQLGQGDIRDRGDNPGEMGANLPAIDLGAGRTAKAIAVGGVHSCALLDNDTVKCWGSNVLGQLGQGDTTRRGDDPGEMGANLLAVDLGAGRTARAIAAKSAHTCALLDDNTVKCWGSNGYGQLGQGDVKDRGDNPGEMGANLAAIDLGASRTAKSIAVGGEHTCAVLDDNTMKCWGSNRVGQLGQGDDRDRGRNPGEMGNMLPAIDLGTRTAQAIGAGAEHTCALLDNNTLKCWGYNGTAQLGQGDRKDRGDNPGEMGDMLPAIILR